MAALETRCPELVPIELWQQTVTDGRPAWRGGASKPPSSAGGRPTCLGLHNIPDTPAPNYRRLSHYEQTGAPAGSPRPGAHRKHCRPAGARPHRQCKKPNTLSTLLQCLAISVEADHFAQPQPTKFSLRRAVRAGCLFRLPPFRPASLPSWASARARAIRPTARLNLNVASLWVRGEGPVKLPVQFGMYPPGWKGKADETNRCNRQ